MIEAALKRDVSMCGSWSGHTVHRPGNEGSKNNRVNTADVRSLHVHLQ